MYVGVCTNCWKRTQCHSKSGSFGLCQGCAEQRGSLQQLCHTLDALRIQTVQPNCTARGTHEVNILLTPTVSCTGASISNWKNHTVAVLSLLWHGMGNGNHPYCATGQFLHVVAIFNESLHLCRTAKHRKPAGHVSWSSDSWLHHTAQEWHHSSLPTQVILLMIALASQARFDRTYKLPGCWPIGRRLVITAIEWPHWPSLNVCTPGRCTKQMYQLVHWNLFNQVTFRPQGTHVHTNIHT